MNDVEKNIPNENKNMVIYVLNKIRNHTNIVFEGANGILKIRFIGSTGLDISFQISNKRVVTIDKK